MRNSNELTKLCQALVSYRSSNISSNISAPAPAAAPVSLNTIDSDTKSQVLSKLQSMTTRQVSQSWADDVTESGAVDVKDEKEFIANIQKNEQKTLTLEPRQYHFKEVIIFSGKGDLNIEGKGAVIFLEENAYIEIHKNVRMANITILRPKYPLTRKYSMIDIQSHRLTMQNVRLSYNLDALRPDFTMEDDSVLSISLSRATYPFCGIHVIGDLTMNECHIAYINGPGVKIESSLINSFSESSSPNRIQIKNCQIIGSVLGSSIVFGRHFQGSFTLTNCNILKSNIMFANKPEDQGKINLKNNYIEGKNGVKLSSLLQSEAALRSRLVQSEAAEPLLLVQESST